MGHLAGRAWVRALKLRGKAGFRKRKSAQKGLAPRRSSPNPRVGHRIPSPGAPQKLTSNREAPRGNSLWSPCVLPLLLVEAHRILREPAPALASRLLNCI